MRAFYTAQTAIDDITFVPLPGYYVDSDGFAKHTHSAPESPTIDIWKQTRFKGRVGKHGYNFHCKHVGWETITKDGDLCMSFKSPSFSLRTHVVVFG